MSRTRHHRDAISPRRLELRESRARRERKRAEWLHAWIPRRGKRRNGKARWAAKTAPRVVFEYGFMCDLETRIVRGRLFVRQVLKNGRLLRWSEIHRGDISERNTGYIFRKRDTV